MDKKYLKIVTITIIVVIVVALATIVYRQFLENQTLENISEGQKAIWSDPAKAESLFTESLNTVADDQKESYAKNMRTLSLLLAGDPIKSIKSGKEVAMDEAYRPIDRAYAVQGLAQTCMSRPDLREEIMTEIFDSEQFSGFRITDDFEASCSNLYRYASSLYPLAYSEFEIAKDYSRKIFDLKEGGKVSPEEIAEYVAVVEMRVDRGNRDIERSRAYAEEDAFLSEPLTRKAEVMAYLKDAGVEINNFEEPEIIFEEALKEAKDHSPIYNEAATAFRYAAYLARHYGEPQKNKISVLLSDFYTTNKFAPSIIVMYYFDKSQTVPSEIRAYVNDVVIVDNNFKEYLEKKGWVF